MIYESNSNMLISEAAALSYYKSAGQPLLTFLFGGLRLNTMFSEMSFPLNQVFYYINGGRDQ
jgi:hypothetical protein